MLLLRLSGVKPCRECNDFLTLYHKSDILTPEPGGPGGAAREGEETRGAAKWLGQMANGRAAKGAHLRVHRPGRWG